MWGYLRLEVLRIVRHWRYLSQAFGAPLLLCLLLSQQAARAASAEVLVSMADFGAMGAAFATSGPRLAAERASGWTRQLGVTPLPPHRYIVAKMIVALALALPSILLLELVGGLVNGVRLPVWTWATIPALLLLGTVPLAALGILLGYLLDTDTAYIGTQLVYLLLTLVGGLWLPLERAPQLIRIIGPLLPSHQLAELGQWAIAGHGPSLANVLALVAYTLAFAALAAWCYRRDEERGIV
jgi:ABC-2 type transport system permease protein